MRFIAVPAIPAHEAPRVAPLTVGPRLLDFHALSRRLWAERTAVTLLLLPLSYAYASLAAMRRVFYDAGILRRERLPVPVVVVGNFLAGGTGKTPLVLALAQAFRARGRHPGIVSRGYAGTSRGPAGVTPQSKAESVGDEPLLLARRSAVPVWVGRDRAAAARGLLGRHPGVDLVILDDGLQHRRLERDFEIAVFDERATGNGLLLPAGPLRERPRRVDAIVWNASPGRAAAGGADLAVIAPVQFEMRLHPAGFYRLHDGTPVDLEWLRARRLHAAAGLGQPERFFDTLRRLGLSFTEHAFPDHYAYRPEDLRFPDCDVVLVTEKDAVKCIMENRTDLVMLRVDAEIDPALVERIAHCIDRRPVERSHG